MERIHNFSSGPAQLPLQVLERAQAEFTNYQNVGASILELSHRGKEYTEINNQAKERLKNLLGLGDEFKIMFLQGGASTQFMQVPLNFLKEQQTANYINTGVWSTKAIKEAKLYGKVNELYSGAANKFTRIPKNDELNFGEKAVYTHYTSNNTIYGTQFRTEPKSDGSYLVCDTSSDFLSHKIDIDKYGLIYAGAQKNLGPAGVTLVIIRNEFLERADKENLPTILNYHTHADKIFNTPPVYAVYMVNLMLKWMEEKGGLEYFEKFNEEKAALLYDEIDADDFYTGVAELESRSYMNVTFRLPNEALEAQFVEEAASNGMIGLKGHRSTGGIRAGIYNSCPMTDVQALVEFMRQFRTKNG